MHSAAYWHDSSSNDDRSPKRCGRQSTATEHVHATEDSPLLQSYIYYGVRRTRPCSLKPNAATHKRRAAEKTTKSTATKHADNKTPHIGTSLQPKNCDIATEHVSNKTDMIGDGRRPPGRPPMMPVSGSSTAKQGSLPLHFKGRGPRAYSASAAPVTATEHADKNTSSAEDETTHLSSKRQKLDPAT